MKEKIVTHKGWFIALSIILLILLGSTGYLIYNILLLNNIENLLRICACILLVLVFLVGVFLSLKSLYKNSKVFYIILLISMLLYSSVLIFVDVNFQIIYNRLNKVSTNYTTYSTSIVTLKNNSATSISEIKDKNIGMISDENNVDGYQIPQDVIKEQKLANIKMYGDYPELITALYEKEIEYIFLPSNYVITFKNIENFSNIEEETKVIFTKMKKEKDEPTEITKNVTEPFTILLMGIDSVGEEIESSGFNGDSLMLLTFNPITLNTTILSIPRDSYVPITCFAGQRKNKISNAAWYGEKCVMQTIENFLDVKIDYYVKINFTGVVKLVDAVGGVEMDIPYSFCEQNSKRQWGNNTIYVEKGLQTLNGEQALAFSRNRHPNPQQCSKEWTNYDSNDFIRGQHQQLVLKALLNKLTDIRDLDTFHSILNTISNSMQTNMSVDQILSFYNVGKDVLTKSKDEKVENLIGMQRLYLSGYDAYIYDYSTINNQGTKLQLYEFIPYKGSIEDIVTAMKENLGLIEKKPIKSFSFDINIPYKEKVIGQGVYDEKKIELLPNFVGKQKEYAVNYTDEHGINLNIEYITTDDTTKRVGEITNQSLNKTMDLEFINKQTGLTITVVEKIRTVEFDYKTCSQAENRDNSNCKLPNFVGKNIDEFDSFLKKYQISIKTIKTEIKETDDDYDSTKAGLIESQNQEAGISLYDLIGQEIEIKYYGIKQTEEDPNETNES